jgi:hypothetical protein
MKYFVLPLALLLAACQTTTGLAPDPKIPNLPANLEKKAEQLPPITDPSLGGIVRDSAASSMQYNEVGTQLNNLIDLYNCVKVSMNDKKDPKECLK